MRQNGVAVYECRSGAGIKVIRLTSIACKYLAIAWRIHAIVVSEAGQSYVPLARALAWLTQKPVIFDAFMSYYHVNVINAKLHAPTSLTARYFYFLDTLGCRLADVVVLDTPEHCDYFHRTFGVPMKKLRSVPVGSDDKWFFPLSQESDSYFNVVLIASFYPIHGVEYVVEAAKQLEVTHPNVRFSIIGNGRTRGVTEALVRSYGMRNVTFHDYVPSHHLPQVMQDAHVCLGQFGNTEQNDLVIPAKVYDAIAMAKPVITARAKALENVFTDRKDVLFCEPANPDSIAKAILLLSRDHTLRNSIAREGYILFQKIFSLAIVGRQFREIIKETVDA